jgi:hypothetical protein
MTPKEPGRNSAQTLPLQHAYCIWPKRRGKHGFAGLAPHSGRSLNPVPSFSVPGREPIPSPTGANCPPQTRKYMDSLHSCQLHSWFLHPPSARGPARRSWCASRHSPLLRYSSQGRVPPIPRPAVVVSSEREVNYVASTVPEKNCTGTGRTSHAADRSLSPG